jgi:hypothetical protein
MKTKKKSNQAIKEALRKRCVKIAKDIAKIKVGYKCEYDGCPRSKKNGYQMHGSHIHGENSHKSMSADVDNILCICAVHHTGGMWHNATEISWHESPRLMVEWFRLKFPERDAELIRRSRISVVCDLNFWQKKHKLLQAELKHLTKSV